MILIKEELVGEFLDNKLRAAKQLFKKLASEQKILKEGIKKIGTQNKEDKRKSSNSILSCTNNFSKLCT